MLQKLPLFFIIISLFYIVACSDSDKKNKENSISIEKIPIKKEQNNIVEINTKPKDLDSINNKNTVSFLTKYGELNKETIVLIKTRHGNIKLKLYKDTPLHRSSFIFLTNVGYFSTTCFYRVVPNFIIQGGESERLDTQGYKAKYMRYKLPAEFKPNRKHKYGALASARDWENNPQKKSTAFEFYIVQNKKGAHHLDGEHTVFGEVISGFSVVDKIANERAGGDEWPLTDVFIDAKVIK